MPRTDLSALRQKIDTDDVEPLQRQADTSAGPDPVAPAESPAATKPGPSDAVSAAPRKRQTAREKKAPTPTTPVTATTTGEPLYLRLVRKETRLREEQYETLTEYARKLNRAKTPGAGERITENTLIRIAIDLLIPQLNEMNGNNEAQLRESVSNRV